MWRSTFSMKLCKFGVYIASRLHISRKNVTVYELIIWIYVQKMILISKFHRPSSIKCLWWILINLKLRKNTQKFEDCPIEFQFQFNEFTTNIYRNILKEEVMERFSIEDHWRSDNYCLFINVACTDVLPKIWIKLL